MIKEDGTVVFEGAEQDELNRIIGERVARVKSEKPTDYDDLIEIAKELEEYGYSGTPAEIKAAIKAHKQNAYDQTVNSQAETGEIPDEKVLQAMSKKLGVAPEKLEKAIKKQIETDDAEEKKKSEDEAWDNQVKEFSEKHSDVDLDELAKNSKFVKFAKKHVGSLLEKYEEFVEFIGESEAEAIIKVKSKEERSTSSGYGGAGAEIKLTKDQKALVDEWNEENPKYKMTYEEYAKKINR